MKKPHLAIAVALLLGAAGLTSCNKNNPLAPNKNNPAEAALKAAAFEVTLLDHERGYDRDSAYVFEGVWKQDAFHFGYLKLDPMVPNILPDGRNQLEFRISSDAAGFEGVNASSSSRCINIVQDGADHTRYHLEWVAEGESTITFWNGEGASRKEISFQATSKAHIPIETIKFRIDGELYEMRYSGWGQTEEFHVLKQFPEGAKWEDLPTFELVPVPLNATLEDEQFILTWLTAALFRVDEKGNGAPLMTDKGLINNDNPWFLSYTYQDLKAFWPEFRWLKTQCHPSTTRLNPDDAIKVNFNDLRERHTKVYTTRMNNGFLNGYCGQIEFRWSILKQENEEFVSVRDFDKMQLKK